MQDPDLFVAKTLEYSEVQRMASSARCQTLYWTPTTTHGDCHPNSNNQEMTSRKTHNIQNTEKLSERHQNIYDITLHCHNMTQK